MDLLKHLLPRQTTVVDGDDDNDRDGFDYYDGWWYSSTAYIIKWAVIAAIFILFIAFFVGGYLHAKRRMKKGLAPLAYHRWMIPRRRRLAFHASHPELPNPYRPSQYQYYGPGAPYRPGFGEQRNYPMGPMYGPPPPAYGEAEWVPPYAPPEGGSKANPNQNVQVREPGSEQESGAVGSSIQGHPGGDLGSRHIQR